LPMNNRRSPSGEMEIVSRSPKETPFGVRSQNEQRARYGMSRVWDTLSCQYAGGSVFADHCNNQLVGQGQPLVSAAQTKLVEPRVHTARWDYRSPAPTWSFSNGLRLAAQDGGSKDR
jgi:hypothetical protein